MKRLFMFFTGLLFFVNVFAQDAYHMKKLGNWNNPGLTPNPNMPGQLWNELTGWVDTILHKEYVIMGSIDSVYFFDVTDPTNIKLCDVEYGLDLAINRDVEVFQHYVYCVSDNSPTRGKLQIYDLNYLPDSVHKVYESDTLGFKTHSMFIEPETKRLYMCINHVGNIIRGMDILSLEKPDSPTYLGSLNQQLFGAGSCQHVHEIYVRRDTGYCSCEYNGLFVIDFKDVNNQIPLGSITPPYPYNGYNHSSTLDSTGDYIAFTDEVPNGLPAKIYKIRDLSDMTYVTHFNTHDGATPHNVFWVGNKLYVSWYQDGVYIFKVDTPRNPRLYAFYDTYPQNDPGVYDNYRGCWGVYPYFPSGNIAASDMSNGLFMLKYDVTVGVNTLDNPIKKFNISPVPFNNELTLHFLADAKILSTLKLVDLQGRVVYTRELTLAEGENEVKIESLSGLKSGLYFAVVENSNGILHRKVMKD